MTPTPTPAGTTSAENPALASTRPNRYPSSTAQSRFYPPSASKLAPTTTAHYSLIPRIKSHNMLQIHGSQESQSVLPYPLLHTVYSRSTHGVRSPVRSSHQRRKTTPHLPPSLPPQRKEKTKKRNLIGEFASGCLL